MNEGLAFGLIPEKCYGYLLSASRGGKSDQATQNPAFYYQYRSFR